MLKDVGEETVTDASHLAKLALVIDGVGRDTISDFTTNLIKHFLCTYTQEFANKDIDDDLLERVDLVGSATPACGCDNLPGWSSKRMTGCRCRHGRPRRSDGTAPAPSAVRGKHGQPARAGPTR